MKTNFLNLALVAALCLGLGAACGETGARDRKTERSKAARSDGPAKVAEETARGFKFIYFRVPAGLDDTGLIETAQKLHESEPEAQLILVDDDSRLQDYLAYTRAITGGSYEAELPKEWADKHIVANVQKYISGKFMLCKGAGYKEIAELQ